MQVNYKFYATLLDAFQNYLSSSEIYQQYYGFGDNPKISEEEFEVQQFQSLIDRINRVPFSSEPADKGTAFNEVIDCLIEFRKSESMQIQTVELTGKVNLRKYKDGKAIQVKYKEHTFLFCLDLCKQIAHQLKGALTQQKVEGVISTKYGDVLLYGYLDQLMPFKVVDLKTTKQYKAFKYRNNWQHKVYPFCLNQNQVFIDDFEYVVTDFKKVYSELYVYDKEKDFLALQNHCEQFIEFLEKNKELITDKKIFAIDNLQLA